MGPSRSKTGLHGSLNVTGNRTHVGGTSCDAQEWKNSSRILNCKSIFSQKMTWPDRPGSNDYGPDPSLTYMLGTGVPYKYLRMGVCALRRLKTNRSSYIFEPRSVNLPRGIFGNAKLLLQLCNPSKGYRAASFVGNLFVSSTRALSRDMEYIYNIHTTF